MGAISGGDVQTIAIVVGSAVAAAVAAAAYRRNRRDEIRSRWRDHDQIHGWVDERGHFHPGAVDQVMGWQDESGPHPGLPERFEKLDETLSEHLRDHQDPRTQW